MFRDMDVLVPSFLTIDSPDGHLFFVSYGHIVSGVNLREGLFYFLHGILNGVFVDKQCHH